MAASTIRITASLGFVIDAMPGKYRAWLIRSVSVGR